MTRRNFLFARLVEEAPSRTPPARSSPPTPPFPLPAPPPAGASGPTPRVRPPEPEIPPEVAERAARFRAELAARGSAAAPTGPIVWQEPDELSTTPVPPWRQ